MEQSHFWGAREANSSSASQEISCILWNAKFHYRFHKTQPLVTTLNQVNLFHAFPSCFLRFHFNIILPLMPKSCNWNPPSCFPTATLYVHFLSPIRFTCLHPSHSYHPNNSCWAVQSMKLLIMQSFPFACYLVHVRPKYLLQHNILNISLF